MADGIPPSDPSINDLSWFSNLSHLQLRSCKSLVRLENLRFFSISDEDSDEDSVFWLSNLSSLKIRSCKRLVRLENLQFLSISDEDSDEDSVNNGWSDDVRLNLHPGQSTVISHGHLNLHPGPSTVISHGTDGLESIVHSVMLQIMQERLRKLVVVNVDDCKKIFDNINLECALSHTPSISNQLNQITNNVRCEFQRLLPLLKTNCHLSLEELEVYWVPLCWSSTQRVQFFGHLSDRLFSKAKGPDQQDDSKEDPLLEELKSKTSLIFDGQWIKKIDEGWFNTIDKGHKPRGSECESVKGLFRFVRNRWHHSDEFQKSKGLRNAQSFYNYFDARFPNLLIVSYGAAYWLCREEPWFKDYLPS